MSRGHQARLQRQRCNDFPFEGRMTTADWALIVSLFSFVVSLAGFIWNVWSKFIYPRAKVRASIAVMLIFDGDGTPPRHFIQLSATNYGPTEITLQNHVAKRRQGFLWFRTNEKLAMLNTVAHPDDEEPAGFTAQGFPKKLTVGESAKVYYSAKAPKRWVEESDIYYFGFSDTFGRYHWCSRANAKKFRADVVEDLKAVPPVNSNIVARFKAYTLPKRTWLLGRVQSAKVAVRKRFKRRAP